MIYGVQLGAVTVGRDLRQGMADCEYWRKEAGLEAVEIDFSHPALFSDGLKARVLISEVDGALEKEIIAFGRNYRIKGGHLLWTSMGIRLVSADERVRAASFKTIEDSLKKASELRLDYATLHAEGCTEDFKGILARLSKTAEGCKVALVVENMGGDEEWLAKTVREINSPRLSMTLDVGHFYNFHISKSNKTAGELTPLLAGFIKTCKGVLGNVHMHDHSGQTKTHPVDHLPIGKGVLDFRPLNSALGAIGYSNSVNLEYGSADRRDIVESVKILRSAEK